MVKKNDVEHVMKVQVAGHFPNWMIQFLCSCGKELGTSAEYILNELSELAFNHSLDFSFADKEEEDVPEDKTDS